MQTFIGDLTRIILEQHGDDLSEICLVFPSKRASVFFKENLVSTVKETVFSPSVMTIEEFVQALRPVTILDSTSLAFEMFPIYRELFPEESFDRYFSWASTLINDFDELDRSLADADKVLGNLHDLRAVDQSIESWLNPNGEPSEFQKRYLRFWEQMPTLYHRLRKRLFENRMAMPGQAMRDLAEKVRENKPSTPWAKIIFAGFHALTPAEELLVASLIRHGLAQTYWDLDRWYVDNPVQEAGRHFRALKAKWENEGLVREAEWKWTGDRLASDAKKISIIGVPKRVGQAKAAGLILKDILSTAESPEKVAVVLPDENLLFPLLHSLPKELRDINVTMGFPLRHTPLFSLVESLVEMHENAERLQPGVEFPRFYFRDIRVVLRHPYVQDIAFAEVRETIKEMEMNSIVFLDEAFFEMKFGADHFLTFLFCRWDSVKEVIQYFLTLFGYVRKECLQRKDGSLSAFEGEYLFQFHNLTQKLRDKLAHYALNLDQKVFRRIFRDMIQQSSIPFAGEPLQGLQVMGMLETRVLDFDHVVVLSVNENILPAKHQNTSFIPMNLRRAFGLPLKEDKDAVFAYHFYRLLQRPKGVHLLHNTEQDTFGMGEKSRFIAQIELELAAQNPNLEIVTETLTFPTYKEVIKPILVNKNEDMLAKLRELMNRSHEGSQSGFSPSALSTYLSCPLKFYFRYILRLKEKDEVEQSMAAHTFGKVLHKVMEQLYLPFKGRTVLQEDIDHFQDAIAERVKEAFVGETKTQNHGHGKNYLLLRVIEDLVRQMLEIDHRNAPFEVIDLELEITGKLVTESNPDGFSLRGFIDRVDRTGGMLRIVDYKTGTVDSLKLEAFEDVLEGEKKKEAFQLAVYTWMYLREMKQEGELMAGVYPIRNLSKGFSMLAIGPAGNTVHDLKSMLPFEDILSGLVNEIFNLELPFHQTEDETRCRYCPYKVMCVRS